MRLLHTSDWHLGRSFHREDLLGAQSRFLDHLVEVVRSESVDAVLVAGDVYDRALPPIDAVSLLDESLRRLTDAGASVVVISGNHDSSRRLGFASKLLDRAGVYVRTDPGTSGQPVLLADEHGGVAIYPLPYLEPDAAGAALECDERAHAAVTSAAMARVRADLAARPGTRSVVMAHLFATGGEASESERDISVGGLCDVPLAAFAGIDYTALGHLHGPQRLSDAVRYSGSPLPYSFSEEHQRKSTWLVELAATGVGSVTRVDSPVHRPLARLRGQLTDLLVDAAYDRWSSHYLAVTLTDPVRPRDPMERLRARFPHTLLLEFDPEGGVGRDASSYTARLRGRSDLDIATGFVEFVRDRAADEWEKTLLREAIELSGREQPALERSALDVVQGRTA